MTFSIALVSFLAIIHQSTSAPFNDRASNAKISSEISSHGWSCSYHGQDPNVDSSLDLPQLVKTLCSQVQYANVGCMAFAPDGQQHALSGTVERPVDVTPPALAPCPPPLQWNATLSICTLEIPYVPVLVDVSPTGQPIMQADTDPAVIKNVTQAMSGYQDGKVYAFSIGDPVVVDDDGGEPDAPSVVVEQAHSESPTPDAPLPPVSLQSSPPTASSAGMAPMIPTAPMASMMPAAPMASMMPATPMAATMPAAPMASMMPTATMVFTMPTTTPQPDKKPLNNKKPSKSPRPSKVNSAASTKSHSKQCGSTHSTGAFSFDSKRSSRSIHSEDSGSCEISQPVHKDKKPSSHSPKPTGTKPASPKAAKHHDDSGPHSSKVTAQSFDEPEGDEDDTKPSSHQDKPTNPKPSSPKPAKHRDDSGSDPSKVTSQSLDEPKGDEDHNKPSLHQDMSANTTKPANHHDDFTPDTSRVTAQSFDEPEGDEDLNEPSSHPDMSSDTKPTSPKPANDHDDSTPDSSRVTAQSFDEPEGDEDLDEPSSHPEMSSDTKPASPKPANDHDDSTPDSSRVTAQSFDEPEGDEDDNQPSGTTQGSDYTPNKSDSPPVSTSSSQSEPQEARNTQSSPQANQESPVGQQAEQECQSPNYWNSTLSLCMSVSGNPDVSLVASMLGSTSLTDQTAPMQNATIQNDPDANHPSSNPGNDIIRNHPDATQPSSNPVAAIIQNATDANQPSPNPVNDIIQNNTDATQPSSNPVTAIIQNATDANHPSSNPVEGNQRALSTPSDCQAPLQWNSVLSMCMDMSALPNTPMASKVHLSGSMNAPANILNPQPSGNAGQAGQPMDLEQACQSPSRWNAELRLCMGISALPNAESFNPSNTLAPVNGNPAQIAQNPPQMMGATSPDSHNQMMGTTSPDSHHCGANETWSSIANKCVPNSMLSSPQYGGNCGAGQYDSLIGMCLNMSILGGSQPNHPKSNPISSNGDIVQHSPVSPVVAQTLKPQSTEGPSCATGQTWSGLAASCVANDRLTHPAGDGSCEAGKYDSLVGMCLSMSILGSPNPTFPTNPAVTSSPSASDNVSSSPIQPITSESVPGCSENQRYDVLALACVNINMLPKSSGGEDCGTGAQFDTVLGRCINMSAAAGLFGSKTTQLTQMKSTSEILSLPSYL